MTRLLFLPGVSGDGHAFWQPVADLLPQAWEKTFLDWPGLGRIPSAADVENIDDLVERVTARLATPAVLVAQSMGGVIAVRTALRRRASVQALVLTATSGGIDLEPFGTADWRPDYRRTFPGAPAWIYDHGPDLSAALATLDVPTLLVWATADPISPVGVGRHLARLMPRATLTEIDCDDHWVAHIHAAEVAAAIERLVIASRWSGATKT